MQVQSSSNEHEYFEKCCPFILERLHECMHHHHMCDKKVLSPETVKLPTRVIDVGSTQLPYANLLETKGATGWYIALSHCWGSSVTFKLEQATLQGMKTKIELDSLPRTFRDAVIVARAFRVRYVWIDSLCIVQDSPEDWEYESSQMAMIFQNAHFTIAASASSHSNGGLFQHGRLRSRMHFLDLDRNLAVYRPGSYMSIKTSALNERAWVLQEWILSPRLIHFAQDDVYWECVSNVSSANNDMDLYLTHNNIGLFQKEEETIFSVQARAAIAGSLQTWRTIYDIWARLVEDYTSRKLTFVSDKFHALTGLTTALERRITDVPIAGLWRADFHLGLLWSIEPYTSLYTLYQDFHRYEPPVPKDPIPNIPSWSWASVDGPVHYNVQRGSRFINELEIMNVSLDWENGFPCSKITDGRIKARGTMRPVHVTMRGEHDGDLCFGAQAGEPSAIPQINEPGGFSAPQWIIDTFVGQFNSMSSKDELLLSIPPFVCQMRDISSIIELSILEGGEEKQVELLHGRGTLDRPIARSKESQRANCWLFALLVATELRPGTSHGGGVIPYANHVLFLDHVMDENDQPTNNRFQNVEYRRVGVGVFWARHGYFERISPQTVEII